MSNEKIKIFLDDVRQASDCLGYMYKRIGGENNLYKEDWVVVRDYPTFCKVVMNNFGLISHVSFDHDLADSHYSGAMYESLEAYEKAITGSTEKTGYECAHFLKNFYQMKEEPLPKIYVHSMNPVGVDRIKAVFNL